MPALAVGLVSVGAAGWYLLSRRDTAPSLKTVTFTQLTDQSGEELYPSLSPDGKSFVYASRAAGNWDIYLQRAGGRNPVNLAKDCTADDTEPAFSPDGEQSAFRSERDGRGIFLMGATGENVTRLTDAGHTPSWSPDGKQIVWSSLGFQRPDYRSFNAEIYITDIATGRKQLVTARDALQPQWSPHAHRIACWGILEGRRTIWTISAQGGRPVPLTNDTYLSWNPVWSPEGRHIYFSSDRGGSMNIWRIPVDEVSGQPAGPAQPVMTASRYSAYITLSRDGRRLAYVQQGRASTVLKSAFDPDRGSTMPPSVVLQSSREALDPDLSPDGQWIAFTMQVPRLHVSVLKLDGTGLRQLTDDPGRDMMPRWSPDGKRIAFQSNRTGKYEAWAVNSDGSGLQQLTYLPGRDVMFPVWSPDGRRMVFTPMGGGNFLTDPGKPWSRQSPQFLPALSVSGLWFVAASWSPDGQTLAGYRASADGRAFLGIAVYDLASRQFEQLTESGSIPRWLSDSRRLLFHDGGRIQLLDTRTKKIHEVLSAAPNEIERRFAVSKDDRLICYVVRTIESDVWLATLE